MQQKRCSKCRKTLDLTAEFWGAQFRAGGPEANNRCRKCCGNDARAFREKKGGKESEDSEDAAPFFNAEPVSTSAFLQMLKPDVHQLIALVDIASLIHDISLRDTRTTDVTEYQPVMDHIASLVWEQTNYRFTYKDSKFFDDTTRFRYTCCQDAKRQNASKKIPDPSKQRNKAKMETFDCDGTLTIWADGKQSSCFIRYQHKEPHKKYQCIDIPPEIIKLIKERSNMRGPQVWKEILKVTPQPKFTYQQIYNHLLAMNGKAWRLRENEEESAALLFEQLCQKRPECAPVFERIELPKDPSDGYSAFAFSLPTLIKKWQGCISEVQLDSTFKTNKAGYECFALMGEVFGSGLPLGFLLIKSNGSPKPGSKELYLRALIRDITMNWDIKPIQTLSDKDITEINAFLGELPGNVKHQLCYWHGIRVLRGHLATTSRPPAHYDAPRAFQEFDFIDKKFLPVAQIPPEDRANVTVAREMIPTVQLRFNGSLIPSVPERPKIIIRLDGHIHDILRSLDESEDLLDILDDEDEFAEHLGDDLDAIDRLEAAESWLEPGDEPIGTAFSTGGSTIP
ncbi:unnamed protein product [Mycena citricolor]|uniref:MULE transposase domain-containing protein n=1 Tax=Mycena citricolor TaxID=2018698 RepID=A0AAD2GWW4_9AGAR|nr:unnamed protein product [Mycena citricolor]